MGLISLSHRHNLGEVHRRANAPSNFFQRNSFLRADLEWGNQRNKNVFEMIIWAVYQVLLAKL
jgi:hypothetical protein